VLFGGNDGSVNLDDTWSYDPSTRRWSRVMSPVSPSPRREVSLAFDSSIDRVVLFGGYTGSANGETWWLDLQNGTWTQRFPSGAPPGRWGQSLTYDPAVRRVVMFGGSTGSPLAETRLYDGVNNSWSSPGPANPPQARDNHAAAWDPLTRKVVIFGGASGGCCLGDTWSYNASRNEWYNDAPSPAPSSRYAVRAAHDRVSGKVTIFGGYTGSNQGDTWVYNPSARVWANPSPSPAPPARRYAALASDPTNGRILMFGGVTGSTNSELWEYSGNPPAAPVVTATSPFDGETGVVQARPVIVDFNLPMNPARTSSSFSISPVVPGTASVSGNRLTWTHTAPLALDTSYTVTISTAATSSAGDAMLAPYSFSFRTRTADCVPAPPGMIGWWTGDNTSADRTGKHNGTLERGAGYAAGTVGYGFSLDGIDDYVNVPYTPEFDLDGKSLTLDAWVNWTGTDTEVIAGRATNFQLHTRPGGQVTFLWVEGGLVQKYLITPGALPSSKWTHVAAVFNVSGPQARIYFDGVLVASGAGSVNGNVQKSIAPLQVGGFGPPSGYDTAFFAGRIDEVELFGRALSDSEVAAISGPGGKCRGPRIVWTSPGDGDTGVALDASVRVVFDTAMDQASTASSFTILPPVSGGSASVSGTTLDWSHSARFAPNTTHTVTISTAAKSAAGESLFAPYSFSFRSLGPPVVVSTSPPAGASAVPLDSKVTVSWDQTMAASPTDQSFSVSPQVAGSVTVSASNLTFSHPGNFTPNTTYAVTISTKAQSAAGINMTSPHVFAFRTASVPPQVISTSPPDGKVGVPVDQIIGVEFDLPMDGASTEAAFSISPPVAGGSAKVSGRNLTFTHLAPLAGTTIYTVTVASTAKSAYGDRLAASYGFDFATRPPPVPPKVVATTPKNSETNVPLNSSVRVEFDLDMDSTSTAAAFNISPPVAGASIIVAGKVLLFTHAAPLDPATLYSVDVSASATSSAGDPMGSDFSFIFITSTSVTPVDPDRIVFTVPQPTLKPGEEVSVYYNVYDASGRAIATRDVWDYSPNEVAEVQYLGSHRFIVRGLQDGNVKITVTAVGDTKNVTNSTVLKVISGQEAGRGGTLLGIPIWALLLALAIAVAILLLFLLLRRRRRAPPVMPSPFAPPALPAEAPAAAQPSASPRPPPPPPGTSAPSDDPGGPPRRSTPPPPPPPPRPRPLAPSPDAAAVEKDESGSAGASDRRTAARRIARARDRQ
jgi:hypothetical protein